MVTKDGLICELTSGSDLKKLIKPPSALLSEKKS